MAYNFNPNFAKHINAKENNKYRHIKRNGDETAYSTPYLHNNMQHVHNTKLINFLEKEEMENEPKLFKLEDIDHPNGWSFKEIDMLGEMGFRIDDDHKMYAEIETPSLKMENDKVKALVYKTDEGYTIETSRRYVFETFNKMIEFIDSIPLKHF